MKIKKVSKHNLEKLRLYLSKQNDTKPGKRQDKNISVKSSTNK